MTATAAIFFTLFPCTFFFQCTPAPAITSQHASGYRHQPQPTSGTSASQKANGRSTEVLLAQNSEDRRENDVWNVEGRPQADEQGPGKRFYLDGAGFHIPSTNARIVLRQNASGARVYSSSPVELRNGGTRGSVSFSGGATIARGDAPGRVFLQADDRTRMGVVVPCTLFARSEACIVTIEDVSYHGSIIIAPEPGGLFTLVNYVDVEDYLRGVVPLEVGKGGGDVDEAVKAQAVAARTYTFRKMQDNAHGQFDLSATVSDQVYGGVGAESDACSKAIRATEGEVLLYHDSLIYAYYHSTCGGRTASIEDVWNKPSLGYLRSVDDENGLSGAYCAYSGSFTWEEQWPLDRFTYIVNRFSRETFPQNPCTGDVRSLTLDSRFSCGRIKQCTVHTSSGAFSYGGDKIRFVFRRNQTGFPILKSCIITDVSVLDGRVVMKGRGYGHGVGLCQTGALGRAKNGKKYDEILHAYYTDVVIRKVIR
jgi:stage II sporulation protein D